MLSDEENKAIERFKNFIYTYQDVIEDEYSDYEEKESAKEYQEVSEKILNIIEKQSKEIEELKKPKYIIDCKTNKITKLTNDFVSKDKIKAIIEELQEDIIYSANPLSIDNSKFAIIVLRSLLEKEFPTTITKEELEKRWKE